MPPDLPGFYYDSEKNRYFPIKGPIPGSSSSSSKTTHEAAQKAAQTQVTKLCRTWGFRTSKLLSVRELDGDLIALNRGKRNFKEEIWKIQASKPVVWKYRGTDKLCDGALQHTKIDVQTPEGQIGTKILLTGSRNGSLSLFEAGKAGQLLDNGRTYSPECVWPIMKENKMGDAKLPGHIWRPLEASLQVSSSISCIKLPGKHTRPTDDCSGIHNALITTLGSGSSGGSVFLLNLFEALDFYPNISMRRRLHKTASLNCTIWTAEYNFNASQAVIGTNLGAALVNLETGTASWVLRSKSDILTQQFDHSGNVVLCGLRNGAILTLDTRARHERFPSRFIKHRIPVQGSSKQWFELKGNINPSDIIFMPSSISCLVSLQLYDQYFLASSMDGSIKLYDNRLTKRGAVQSYEGHVNSHTRLQLGVDQDERFVMSGGEDCYLRSWDIKSGQLLWEDKFCNSSLSNVCWEKAESRMATQGGGGSCTQNTSYEAWLGSDEGLFRMCLP